MRGMVEDYLKEMSVPTKYANLMFSIPKDQIRLIDESDFESDFEGYIPDLQDWLDAKCNKLTDVEKTIEKVIEGKKIRREKLTESEERMNHMLSVKLFEQGKCLAQVLSELRRDAWKQFRGQ
jgi:hypothetical protein